MGQRAYITTLLLVVMMSCQRGDDIVSTQDNSVVSFCNTTISTRVEEGGSSWEYGDAIGIYMCDAGSVALSSEEPYKEFVVSSSSDDDSTTTYNAAEFSEAAGVEPYIYPNSYSAEYDFYAFYPYSLTLRDNHIAEIDLAQEGGEQSCDLLLAQELNMSRSDGDVAFNFYHRMSRLVINISLNDNVTSLAGVAATISELGNRASYDVLGGAVVGELECDADYTMEVSESTTKIAVATALVHPQELTTPATVTFTIGEDKYRAVFSTGTLYEQSKQYSYNISLGNDYVYFDSGDNEITPWGEEDGESQYNTIIGTNSNPYIISSSEDMKRIGEQWSETKCYRLEADIDISGDEVADYAILQDGFSFDGLFDGNYHTIRYCDGLSLPLFKSVGSDGVIRNLTISSDETYEIEVASDNFGLFAGENYGTIYSCTSENHTIKVPHCQHLGGIVGINYGEIYNCTNSSSIDGLDYIGGIAGNNDGGVVSSCTNTGTVTGEYHIGGIVGVANKSYIDSCDNYGNIYSIGDTEFGDLYGKVGGIAGESSRSTITNCHCYDNCTIGNSEHEYIGGIVGYTNLDSTISYCENDAAVIGDEHVGGIAGYSIDTTIMECINRGSIKGQSHVGSIVGENWGEIIDCVDDGSVVEL